MAKRLDFTNPETIKKAATFPFYGQAESLIRTIDPLWKTDLGEPRLWKVRVERDTHYCECEYCDRHDYERKTVAVEACTPDEAQAAAFEQLNDSPDWEVESITIDRAALPFPDWIYETEGAA